MPSSRAALERGRPVSGHIYGREFVAAYAASGVTDTHEAIDRDIADDLLEAGVWIFLRGGPPTTPWHSLPQGDQDDHRTRRLAQAHLRLHRRPRCRRSLAVRPRLGGARGACSAGMSPRAGLGMGSLHPATRFGMDGEIGGLGGGRRADLVLLDDDLELQNTWYGGELVVENRRITPRLDQALSSRYRYPAGRLCDGASSRASQADAGTAGEAACTVNAIRPRCRASCCSTRRCRSSPAKDWADAVRRATASAFVAVVERHGTCGGSVAHGLLKDFGLKRGAVASSVGHD